ncbi:hypothetical protein HDU93_003403, partial [Gonapodya sp. JEL0774]
TLADTQFAALIEQRLEAEYGSDSNGHSAETTVISTTTIDQLTVRVEGIATQMEQLTTRYLTDTESLLKRVKDIENRNTELLRLAQTALVRADEINVELSAKLEQATFQLTAKLNQSLLRVARLEQQVAAVQGAQTTRPAQIAPVDVKKLMHVVTDFVPADADEISLTVGNTVFCNLEYQDGWGSGFNTSTGAPGFFPMSCMSDTASPRALPVSIGVRTTSIVNPFRPVPVSVAGIALRASQN